jgi:predicted nucleic acid-binding protein
VSYLIDTNVLSELRRKEPDVNVVNWMNQRPARSLYLSVLTIGELRKGIEALPIGNRKTQLVDWLEQDLTRFFSGRVLTVDHAVADRWGRLMAQAQRPLPAIDSLLAATALVHDLTLVTRNVNDFQHPGLVVIDPWQKDH